MSSTALLTYDAALSAGELQQFNRNAGGAITPYVQSVGLQAGLVAKVGPGILYGFFITTGVVGTLTAYDNTVASGVLILNALPIAAANNVFVAVGPNGAGVMLNTGLTIVVATGASTINVFVV